MKPQRERVSAAPAAVDWRPHMPVLARPPSSSNETAASLFDSDSWALHEAGNKATSTKRTLAFRNVSTTFRDSVKRIAWCMLNLEVPINEVSHHASMRTRLSVGSAISNIEAEVRPFIKWVEARGIPTLSDITEEVLRSYGDYVAGLSNSRSYKSRLLWGPIRFWLYAKHLPHKDRLIQPPWSREGFDDLLGPAQWDPENKTHPISSSTISHLLFWSMKIVDELAESTIEALAEKERLLKGIREKTSPGDKRELLEYINSIGAFNNGLPGFRGNFGLMLGAKYIAAMSGVGLNCIKQLMQTDLGRSLHLREGCPLKTAPNFLVNDRAALDYFDFYTINQTRDIVSTACLIVIAYLSGMRSEECRNLRRESCIPVESEDNSIHYEIHSHSFKDAVDSNGNAIVGGRMRETPWKVIAPVAKAFRVMERLHDQDHLFSKRALQDFVGINRNLVLDSSDISKRVENFISWCNDICAKVNSLELSIPEDPDGRISMTRFRRTLAWFIYRRPGGRISLGIQFGHLHGMTTDGYGSRVSNGLRDVFPIEEALARAESLHEASIRLNDGEGVSGPSAEKYIIGINSFSSEYGGKFLTKRQAAKLLRDPQYRIYDNGAQPVACCYDPTQAMCHPDLSDAASSSSTPNLTRCVPKCPNVARTDTHIDSIKEEILMLQKRSNSGLYPDPIRIRFRERADSLENIVRKHSSTRISQ